MNSQQKSKINIKLIIYNGREQSELSIRISLY